MDAEFARIRFKALMVEVRFLSEYANAELAQVMHRELEREVGFLIPKFRTSNDLLKNSIAKNDSTVIESRPAG